MQTTTANPAQSRTRPTRTVRFREPERATAGGLLAPTPQFVRLDRAVRWALVGVSIGLLLLGINP